jgi:hypothetical protein
LLPIGSATLESKRGALGSPKNDLGANHIGEAPFFEGAPPCLIQYFTVTLLVHRCGAT